MYPSFFALHRSHFLPETQPTLVPHPLELAELISNARNVKINVNTLLSLGSQWLL